MLMFVAVILLQINFLSMSKNIIIFMVISFQLFSSFMLHALLGWSLHQSSGVHPQFLVGFVFLDLLFSVYCFVNHCLSFFFWPLCCLSFFDFWVSSHFIYNWHFTFNLFVGSSSGQIKPKTIEWVFAASLLSPQEE